MKISQRLLLLLATTLALAACYRVSSYTGAGTLVDNGWLAYDHRYSLDLGPLDLAAAGEHSYRLHGLPPAEFVIGLRISKLPQSISEPPRIATPAKIRVQLSDLSGQVVVLEEAPLSQWVWSGTVGGSSAELHRDGIAKDVPVGGGDTRSERLNIRSSGGWGTRFTPNPSDTYLLSVRILVPDKALQSKVRLGLVGFY